MKSSILSRALFLPFVALSQLASANTEKAIFLGPPPAANRDAAPLTTDVDVSSKLEALRLQTLTPEASALRTNLTSDFPSISFPRGYPTWLLLDNLSPGQRYEVRVCWAAIQPTAFTLNTYELPVVFENPELISELSEFAWSRPSITNGDADQKSIGTTSPTIEGQGSALLLQILSAADYYTTDQRLMNQQSPVHVDIILDPFVWNVLPRSLIPSVGYIIAVTIASWFIARQVSGQILQAAKGPVHGKKSQ